MGLCWGQPSLPDSPSSAAYQRTNGTSVNQQQESSKEAPSNRPHDALQSRELVQSNSLAIVQSSAPPLNSTVKQLGEDLPVERHAASQPAPVPPVPPEKPPPTDKRTPSPGLPKPTSKPAALSPVITLEPDAYEQPAADLAPPSPTRAQPPPHAASFVSSLFHQRRARDPSKPASTCRVFELTDGLLIRVVSLLDLSEAASLCCTCSALRNLITNDNLWQSLIMQRLRSAGQHPLNGAAKLHSWAPPTGVSPEPITPFTTTIAASNGFIRHRAPKKSVEHEHGERWSEVVGALLQAEQFSEEALVSSWGRVVGPVPPPYLQNLYYSFATGATCTRPLMKRDDQLQASFLVVLPGQYEVVWSLKFRSPKLGQAGHMRFDTCVTYHHLDRDRAVSAEYGNKSTVWNGAQLSTLESKHGRGSWVGVVVTALKVARLCQAQVAVKGMEDSTGIWVRKVQLRRVVGDAAA